MHGHVEVVQPLVNSGAEINLKNNVSGVIYSFRSERPFVTIVLSLVLIHETPKLLVF